jgi:predicted membrane protein
VSDVPAKRPRSELATQVDDAKTATAVLNSTTLRVTWEPPELQQVVSVLGNVVVDYRDAEIPLGVTGLDCAVYLGNVEILMPEDVDVELTGTVFLGSVETKGGRRRRDDDSEERPLVSIDCSGLMGNVVVKLS